MKDSFIKKESIVGTILFKKEQCSVVQGFIKHQTLHCDFFDTLNGNQTALYHFEACPVDAWSKCQAMLGGNTLGKVSFLFWKISLKVPLSIERAYCH